MRTNTIKSDGSCNIIFESGKPLEDGGIIAGFGHRAYHMPDPRVVVLRKEVAALARKHQPRIIIAGGGNVGLYVASQMEQKQSRTKVKIIEAHHDRAVMVADQVRDWLENGNVTNSVNFPEIQLPRNGGHRIAVVNSNVPNMVAQISSDLGEVGLNIIDLLNRSRGDIACTLIDVDRPPPQDTVDKIAAIQGVLSVRCLGCAKDSA